MCGVERCEWGGVNLGGVRCGSLIPFSLFPRYSSRRSVILPPAFSPTVRCAVSLVRFDFHDGSTSASYAGRMVSRAGY